MGGRIQSQSFRTRTSASTKAGLLAAVVFAVSACGLESIAALRPPGFVESSDIDNWFVIQLDGSYDPFVFRGVEYYYRIYTKEATSLASDLETHSEVISNGFKRLNSPIDTTTQLERPLLPIGSGTVTLTILGDLFVSGSNTYHAYITGPAAPINTILQARGLPENGALEVRRGVADTNGKFKAWDDFVLGDDDIDGVVTGTGDDQEVQLALYAFNYGKEDIATRVYSRAVYLGNIFVDIDVESE